jgi:hypothetical protein
MENKRKKYIVFVLLSIAILLINVLIIVFSQNRVAITKYSIPSLVFAFCSIIYAIIAISLREHFNLFFLNLYIVAKMFNKSYNQTQVYKEEFLKYAFVYCSSIPFYITIALFVDNFYSGIIRPLDVSIVRDVVIILLGLIPPIIKNISNQRQQRIKDEADRKEQERLESMGKWK